MMTKKKIKNVIPYIIIMLAVLGAMSFLGGNGDTKKLEAITSTQFNKYLETDKIKSIDVISDTEMSGVKRYEVTLSNDQVLYLFRDNTLYIDDVKTFESKDIIYQEEVRQPEKSNPIMSILINILVFGLIIFAIFFFLGKGAKSQQKSMLGSMDKKFEVLDFTNKVNKDSQLYSVGLDDIIGLPKNTRKQVENMAKQMKQIVSGKVIGKTKLSGLLLYGDPGTGKTMLAKGLAKEIQSYFIHVDGSSFVDRLVGQGAANVESLFKLARKTSIENNKAPVIIFIDEIDSIGKKREGSGFGGSDEREATLNKILNYLNGSESEANVFVVAATNLKDVLDPALLRSGRLSKHIKIGKPDKDGRKDLFEFYFSKLPQEITVSEDVNTEILAEYSVNMTGADIAEITNNMIELANGVDSKLDFNLADMIDLIEEKAYGTIHEELMKDKKQLEETAYHEAGHALLALKHFPKNVLKACVTPRQNALGYVYHNIMDNRVSLFRKESEHYIELVLGGLVAEKLIFNDTSSGVSNDLEQANRFARNLVQKYGTGDTLIIKPDEQFKEGLSDNTMSLQETEMANILNKCRNEAENFLTSNKDLLDKFAKLLLDKKTLNKNDIEDFYNENKVSFE